MCVKIPGPRPISIKAGPSLWSLRPWDLCVQPDSCSAASNRGCFGAEMKRWQLQAWIVSLSPRLSPNLVTALFIFRLRQRNVFYT